MGQHSVPVCMRHARSCCGTAGAGCMEVGFGSLSLRVTRQWQSCSAGQTAKEGQKGWVAWARGVACLPHRVLAMCQTHGSSPAWAGAVLHHTYTVPVGSLTGRESCGCTVRGEMHGNAVEARCTYIKIFVCVTNGTPNVVEQWKRVDADTTLLGYPLPSAVGECLQGTGKRSAAQHTSSLDPDQQCHTSTAGLGVWFWPIRLRQRKPGRMS